MRKNVIAWTAATLGSVAALAFAAGIVGSAIASDESDTHGKGSGYEAAGEAGSALPMEQLVAKLKEQGYSEIYEIERERGAYEVKARGQDGQAVELHVDAKTGQILRQKMDD